MSHSRYIYMAYESIKFFSDAKPPPSDMFEGQYPEEVIVHIAKKLMPLGDGPGRLRDLAMMCESFATRQEEKIALAVARVLERGSGR